MSRIAKLHPNVKHNVRPTAKYVSRKNNEYEILSEGALWLIHTRAGFSRFKHSRFTSFDQAERTLIQFLKETDKFGRAVYPGSHLDG